MAGLFGRFSALSTYISLSLVISLFDICQGGVTKWCTFKQSTFLWKMEVLSSQRYLFLVFPLKLEDIFQKRKYVMYLQLFNLIGITTYNLLHSEKDRTCNICAITGKNQKFSSILCSRKISFYCILHLKWIATRHYIICN